MNSKSLILIDAATSVVILLTSFLFRLRTKMFQSVIKFNYPKKILVIKFLGAGNLIAMSDVLSFEDCEIVTVKANVSAIREFIPHASVISLDQTNFIRLFFSCIRAFLFLIFSKYNYVVNLEAESSFAKFIASIPLSKNLNGLSNKYKSFFDWFFYDFYLVSPSNVQRDRILELLIKNSEPSINLVNYSIIESLNSRNVLKSFKTEQKLFISPSCSPTDNNRRLNIKSWIHFIEVMRSNFSQILIAFPSKNDIQYDEFTKTFSSFGNIQIVIEPYTTFKKRIADCDVLATIDSQALHIGQKFSKKIICFYGPTSPHGVKLSKNTYILSKEFECSPCTHKYFEEPCRGRVPCMHYNKEELSVIVQRMKIQ
jgi:ADP-heptose:LPS heptosyltransferase